ncbi:MAG: ribonuclease III [Desulfobulbaceae bacterium S3730MH12]|nr:MAG: ribonuclease III [Desulfobulbaceae bacterium S5133MH15]OEU56652.1 MAG: ribonuclease III [Desulfobulbaceae bacterium S3730MH12]OEU79009.1 MAG: ribonuclease III [Desulfobulbaceae bacterium C00003063]
MGMDIDSLVRMNKATLSRFERIIDYRFTDLRLLQRALVHSSYAFEEVQAGQDNQTLEFLGDAVLDLVVGHILYQKYPQMREGELTRLRSALVNETHLANMARDIMLGEFLSLGKGEDASNGRNKSSILSCGYEAVIGAIFEDTGYQTVRELIEKFFMPAIEGKQEELLIADAKSRLQEALQDKHNEGPLYIVEAEEGPSHQKLFTIAAHFHGTVLGTGQAGSKKEAEQRAAAAALEKLQNDST